MSVMRREYSMLMLTLSKATTSMPPHNEMCFECKQKMPIFSSLFWAKALLAVRAAGRMGGTTKVRMSKLLRRISSRVP